MSKEMQEKVLEELEHLTLILQGRACEEWNYDYVHNLIVRARKEVK